MLLTIQNAGRSPAEIERIQTRSLLVRSDVPLPSKPFLGKCEDIPDVAASYGEIVPAGEERPLFAPIQNIVMLNEEHKAGIRSGRFHLWCYGRVIYHDISRAERITYFGFQYYVRRTPFDKRPETMYRIESKDFNFTM